MDYFDYETVARQAGLTPEQVQRITQVVRRDYPSDPMLFELHMFRACRALRDKTVTLEQVLAEPAPTAPSGRF